MPGYSSAVCVLRPAVKSTILPLSASSGSADGSWPMTTFGSVPLLIAETSLAVVSSALAMYWPTALMPLCALSNVASMWLISAWVSCVQYVTVTVPPDEPDGEDEPPAAAATTASTHPPASPAGREAFWKMDGPRIVPP